MKRYNYSEDKNRLLKKKRNITFNQIITDIENGKLLDVIEHPNQHQHPGQSVLIVNHDNYIYVVPYIENENEYFLKTIFSSRKLQKKYLGS